MLAHMKSFSHLPLSEAMLKNLKNLNYNTMTPIQEKTIPEILKGDDILAQAKTGSGKTAAFGIGLLHQINTKRYRIQALVLCPTRELADQVTNELRRLAKFQHNLKLLQLTGGLPMRKQEHSLSHEAHIVIGTPGRVLRLLQRESLVLNEVKMLILDEADRMLDMGFIEQITNIINYAPADRQTLCFSATFPEEIKTLCSRILKSPKQISVETNHDPKTISQTFYDILRPKRGNAVLALLKEHRPDSTLIFCNTKDACRRLSKELNDAGLHSLALHGDLEQTDRTKVLIRFKNGSSKVLIATDVAARGLDIDDLGAVINYDMPFETETYVHRIGRTGRAGRNGMAISLVPAKERFKIDEINKFLNSDFQIEEKDLIFSDPSIDLNPEMITLSINGGRKNKISAGDILGALTAENGISGSDVGKIDRLDYLTFVAVKRSVASKAAEILENSSVKGRQFKVMINE